MSAVQKSIEPGLLIGAQRRADGGVEITLLLVEALSRLAVDGFETLAAVVQDLPHLVPLRGIELQFRREAADDLARRRAEGTTAEEWPASRSAATESRRARPIKAAAAVESRGAAGGEPPRRYVTAEEKPARAAEAEHSKHEEREPDPRPVIGHACLPPTAAARRRAARQR